MATPNIRLSSAAGSRPDSGNTGAIEWQCPNCHSSDLVKLSLVYAAGISGIDAHSRGRGLALAENGIAVSFSGAETTGTLQTQLSRIASPPHKKRYRYFVLAWVLGLVSASWLAIALQAAEPRYAADLKQGFVWLAWIYCGFLAWMLWVLWRYNHRLYPQRYREWNRSFICRRCGKIVRIGLHP